MLIIIKKNLKNLYHQVKQRVIAQKNKAKKLLIKFKLIKIKINILIRSQKTMIRRYKFITKGHLKNFHKSLPTIIPKQLTTKHK